MRVKIFACHHQKPAHHISTELFQSLVSGVAVPEAGPVWSDLAGRNIANREKFCELRHQYYIWQNLLGQYDYVGFEHYRRPFFLDPLPLERFPELATLGLARASDPMNLLLRCENAAAFAQLQQARRQLGGAEQARIKQWIGGHDVIFTRPIFQPINQNFIATHSRDGHLWDALVELVARTRPHGFLRRYLSPPAPWSGYLNMYIMRSEWFCEYMDAIMPPLLELDRQFPDAPGRIWGFVSERLLGPFLIHKMLEVPLFQVSAVPHIMFSPAACMS